MFGREGRMGQGTEAKELIPAEDDLVSVVPSSGETEVVWVS